MNVGIIGLGYVGLPLAKEFALAGCHVTGFDIDTVKVDSINAGRSYILTVLGKDLKECQKDGRFKATSDFGCLSSMDSILICVPTPLEEGDVPDMSYIRETVRTIGKYLVEEQLVVLESTTYPGTTDEVVKPILEEASGLVCGTDFYLAYSPEREDPGNPNHSVSRVPKVVGGMTPDCLDRAVELYSMITDVHVVSDTRTAEAAKMLENTYRLVNISLVNELKVLFYEMGIDIWEVIKAASTKPFGFQPFYPGPGTGGHCLPLDPFYLSWVAKKYKVPTKFIDVAGEVNVLMPDYVVGKVSLALNSCGRSVQGSTILVVGVAYKPNVDDVRESAAIEIITKLKALGATVDYHDPYVSELPPLRHHPDLKMSSVPFNQALADFYAAVVITTNHDCIDFSALEASKTQVIDTRNSFEWTRKIWKA